MAILLADTRAVARETLAALAGVLHPGPIGEQLPGQHSVGRDPRVPARDGFRRENTTATERHISVKRSALSPTQVPTRHLLRTGLRPAVLQIRNAGFQLLWGTGPSSQHSAG